MTTDNMILVEQLVLHHRIEITFIDALSEMGLVEMMVVDDCAYLPTEQLTLLERIIRLHYELGINLEGIDAILHLQQRIAQLQQDLIAAQNRLLWQ